MTAIPSDAANGRSPVYRRVLLKLSGEALMGDLDYGTDPDRVQAIAAEIASVRERAEAHSILREVEYVELSGRSDFNDMFIDQLAFPG